MRPHALVLEAETEAGIAHALDFAEKELGISGHANPDVLVLRYGLLSIEEARNIFDHAAKAPLRGAEKVLIIAAQRLYHEAQNALLKLFEEPPVGTTLILVLPSVGGLLPTLRSRAEVRSLLVDGAVGGEAGQAFLKASREKRTALIKKLTSGKDENARRENRDEAIAILNGVEQVAYDALHKKGLDPELVALLEDIVVLRDVLHDRSAPVRMILEHVSLVLPAKL